MGKKGSWFSAIKRVFTHSSKDKVADGTDKKSSKEKKKGLGKLKRGDGHSFMPLFREPSSIEQILGEAEREHHFRNNRPPAEPERSKIPPHVTPMVRNATLLWDDGDGDSLRADTPPRAPSPPRDVSPPRVAAQSTAPPPAAVHPPPPPPPRRVAPPPQAAPPARVPSPRPVRQWRPEPTLQNQHICAIKIQTAYRGYMARRSYRALRGLVRLQGVVKGQSVKRQTANALRCMQMLVRVQTQIQARRVQMLENQAPQRQGLSKNEKDLQTAFGKWMSENQADWDDSTLTKEEIEARMQKKFDAILKRERAMAYAYSHQSCKSTPRIGHGALADFRTGGYPYWWNWLEKRQPPPTTTLPTNVSKSPSMKSFLLTPTRPTMDFKASPFPQSGNATGRLSLGFENMDTSTPKSTRSSIPAMTRQARTPPGRLPPRFSRGSATNSPFNGGPFRDDDSLTSCPPFSGPRYMSPTASAQAKLKLGKEQFPNSPSSITSDASKRRASFPLGRSPGSFRWNKGSLFSNKETSSQRSLGKNPTAQSVGNLSIDSSTSMPVSVGRKPFNRFV